MSKRRKSRRRSKSSAVKKSRYSSVNKARVAKRSRALTMALREDESRRGVLAARSMLPPSIRKPRPIAKHISRLAAKIRQVHRTRVVRKDPRFVTRQRSIEREAPRPLYRPQPQHDRDRKHQEIMRRVVRSVLDPCAKIKKQRAQRKAVLLSIGKVNRAGGAPGPYRKLNTQERRCQ